MWPEMGYLERRMGEDLGLRLALDVAHPGEPTRLTAGERSRASGFTSPTRRDEWLAGRAALKRVLGRIGLPDDTCTLRFPHPRVSLTHAHGVAVAVGARPPTAAGIGIDLQTGAAPTRRALRFFLESDEQAWVEAQGEAAAEAALRLWTVKEAVFKADPENEGRILHDYVVASPDRWIGYAARGSHRFRYTTMAVPTGFLTVAIHERSGQ